MDYTDQKNTYEAEMFLDPEGNRRLSVRGDLSVVRCEPQKSARLTTHFFDEQPTLFYLDMEQLDWLIDALQGLRPYAARPEPIPPF